MRDRRANCDVCITNEFSGVLLIIILSFETVLLTRNVT